MITATNEVTDTRLVAIAKIALSPAAHGSGVAQCLKI
jgi:hypothetical protein